MVDHIAKTAVGARLSDIARFVSTATPQQLSQIEAEMNMSPAAHQFEYDPYGG